MSLQCVKLPPTKRNRKTKASLQRELDILKEHLMQREVLNLSPNQSSASMYNVLQPQEVDLSVKQRQSSLTPTDGQEFTNDLLAMPNTLGSQTIPSMQTSTLPRSVDGREYDATCIDECFKLYFSHYHPNIPIIDPQTAPNQCYDQSSFLFWVIVTTGARLYSQDPVMIEVLGPVVKKMGFEFLASSLAPIHTLQGILILCSWAPPLKLMRENIAYVASGAALHLAVKLGLHCPDAGQESALGGTVLNPKQLSLRARLWSFTCIICQATSESLGLPPSVGTDFAKAGRKGSCRLSVELQFYHDLADLQGRAMTALVRQASLGSDPFYLSRPPETDPLRDLIKTYDLELENFGIGRSFRERRLLHLQYCRLHVNAFLFLTILGNQAIDHPSFVNLYNLAALVINSTTSIYKCSASRTDYASMTMILAACIILKISRSHLADHVDVDRGRKAYFTAIAAFRDPTLRHIGISSRAAMVLMQLWGCQRLISRIEGDVDGLKLGVQSRSSMSIVFDCFLWWKEQLQGENDSCAHSAKELQEVSSTEDLFACEDLSFFSFPMNIGQDFGGSIEFNQENAVLECPNMVPSIYEASRFNVPLNYH
ncbi:uncharacterized protein TrAFT101_002325 [Trichoderma asperellum]|nr:hypothetical protein TrAFT101_002325 [Trichoderma asperellum]